MAKKKNRRKSRSGTSQKKTVLRKALSASQLLSYLQQALQHHQNGRLDKSEKLYRKVLASEPNQPDANNLLGVLCNQTGDNESAAKYLGRAVKLNPNFPEAHNNFGNALGALGRLQEAEESYRKALALRPNYFEAYNNLGSTLMEKGALSEAEGRDLRLM